MILTRPLPFIFLFSLFLPMLLCAQQADSTKISIAQIYTIHSQILHEDRKIYVYTPSTVPGFFTPQGPFPVLYMLDAEFQLPLVAGLVDYLSKAQGIIPPTLIVGIDNNHFDRERDLTPTHSDKADPFSKPDTSATAFTKTSGGGEKFLRFLHEELMPWVEQRYPVAPFRIFSGHSLGGLLSFYCLLKHPGLFNAYIAISPSVWWDDGAIVRQVGEQLTGGSMANKYLFLSISSEGGLFYQDIQAVRSALQQKAAASGLSWQYQYYSDETHGSGPARAMYDALKFIFAHVNPSLADTTATRLQQFYTQFKAHYGYAISPDENRLVNLGYHYLDDLRCPYLRTRRH